MPIQHHVHYLKLPQIKILPFYGPPDPKPKPPPPHQIIPDKDEIERIVAQPYTTQEQILQNSYIPLDRSFVNVQMSFPVHKIKGLASQLIDSLDRLEKDSKILHSTTKN